MASSKRFITAYNNAVTNNKLVDVSNLTEQGTQFRTIAYPNHDYNGKKIYIKNVSLISNSYEKFKLAIDFLGEIILGSGVEQYLQDFLDVLSSGQNTNAHHGKQLPQNNLERNIKTNRSLYGQRDQSDLFNGNGVNITNEQIMSKVQNTDDEQLECDNKHQTPDYLTSNYTKENLKNKNGITIQADQKTTLVDTHKLDEPVVKTTLVDTHKLDEQAENHKLNELVEAHTLDESAETPKLDQLVEAHTLDELVDTHKLNKLVERNTLDGVVIDEIDEIDDSFFFPDPKISTRNTKASITIQEQAKYTKTSTTSETTTRSKIVPKTKHCKNNKTHKSSDKCKPDTINKINGFPPLKPIITP